jgi:hypothetical protein
VLEKSLPHVGRLVPTGRIDFNSLDELLVRLLLLDDGSRGRGRGFLYFVEGFDRFDLQEECYKACTTGL